MSSPNPLDKEAKNPHVPGLTRNFISLAGLVIATTSLICIIFLFLVDMLGKREHPYIGIFAYIVFPAIMIVGLLLVLLGMILERRRRHKGAVAGMPFYPRIDLNNPRQRRGVFIFVVSSFIFLFLSTFGSYQAYEFTDSVMFCGQTCHSVMHPEFIAYQNSPHARVGCVDCHVGPGATWYVRSKLSGAYQVYAVLFKKYPTPIHTPVKSLRPAQETCEQCHWPEKFFGAQMKVFSHFASDENNTPTQIRMLINTGGGSAKSGFVTGIHWHMNIANEITYISTDEQRQVIPWVQMKDRQGQITEYVAKDSTLTPEEIAKASKRRMDCVDCHNRPSHIYVPPDRSVDESLLAGRLDRTLPYIKQQAIQTLTKSYATTNEATRTIATDLENYYRSNYSDRYAKIEGSVKGAISEVQRIFTNTIFPEMKVDWRTHPDNLSHYYFTGCFRCHDGQHMSREGKVVRNDCNICHTVLDQIEGGAPVMPVQGKPFKHPVDLGDFSGVKCIDCHSGGGSNP